MSHKTKELENPRRVQELKVETVLDKLEVGEGTTFCDIGAGSGLFSVSAANRGAYMVYALEISEKSLAFLQERKEKLALSNMEPCKAETALPLLSGTCDSALMATVYHELDDPEHMILEAHRVLKEDGLLGVVEFHKRETPIGPPLPHRIGHEEVEAAICNCGFVLKETISLSDNFYLSLFSSK